MQGAPPVRFLAGALQAVKAKGASTANKASPPRRTCFQRFVKALQGVRVTREPSAFRSNETQQPSTALERKAAPSTLVIAERSWTWS